MNLNYKVKTLLIAGLASVSAVGLLMATATTAQAKPEERTPSRLAVRVGVDTPPRRSTLEVRRPAPARPTPNRSARDRSAPPAPVQLVLDLPPVPRR